MIKIAFDPQLLTGQLKTEWDAWQLKAEAATNAVIQAWEDWRENGSHGEFKYEFDEKIWSELKDWLIKNVFHDKCAYCETREVRSPYHAEHFRPKARVTVKAAVKGKKKTKLRICSTVDELGKTIKHPGYFWLAYTWTNLLPSCNDCNTALGKKDQFPITVTRAHIAAKVLTPQETANLRVPRIQSPAPHRANIYYLQPEDLGDLEEPLLLHPYLDNPSDHLVFGEFGVVTPRDDSEKGRHSIEVYNLDAERLNTARQIAQETVLKEYVAELSRGRGVSRQARLDAAKAEIAGYIKGEEPYAAAVLANLRFLFPTHGLPDVP